MEKTTVKTPPEKSPNPIITKPILSFSNGVTLKHNHDNLYRECMKNHAAAMGGHAVDGCGEFMPSLSPPSLLCSACGCHRNFHRRVNASPENIHRVSEYLPVHRHHPPAPLPAPELSPSSASPPPISSTYYPSAPHMLLALSTNPNTIANSNPSPSSSARKRFRTRFTQTQKEKMFEFAERLGWKMQRRDEDLINGFCSSIGVEKGVFKVWMHNNKNTLGRRDSSEAVAVNGINLDNTPLDSNNNNYRSSDGNHDEVQRNGGGVEVSGNLVGTNGNGSSSSS